MYNCGYNSGEAKMQSGVLEIRNVTLDIPIMSRGSFKTNGDMTTNKCGGILVGKRKGRNIVRAISDVSIIINEGDRIALLGRNGSGKTTLLKLACGIYEPSSGTINGRRFDPLLNRSFKVSEDLTGLDAIKAHYLSDSRNFSKEYGECASDIIKASGLGEFARLPIRTYSTGMAERLMFCLATYFSRQALAIDEGFGTADASFQKYAESMFNNFLRNANSLLFASHSTHLLRQFCNKGCVLEKGTLKYQGSVVEAIEYYESQMA